MSDMSREILEAYLIHPVQAILAAREAKKRDPKGTNPYRASSAGDCPRKLAYGLYFPELGAAPSARFGAIMDIGNALHELVERWFELAGVDVLEKEKQYNIDILPGVKMRPRIDFMVKVDGKRVIVDVKTMSDAGFDNFVRNGMDPKHKAQLHCYAIATNVKRLSILGINKSTGQMHLAYTDYDPQYMAYVRSLFMQVKKAKPEKLPERMYDLTPHVKELKRDTHKNFYRMKAQWQCTYCPFFKTCRAEDDLTMTIESGKPVWWREMTEAEKDAYFDQKNGAFARGAGTDEELELVKALSSLGKR